MASRSGPLRKARGVLLAASVAGALVPQVAQAQFFWERSTYSPDDAARVAIQHGFRVLSRPMRNDDVYVVDVIDRRGLQERLIISGDTGQILQRTVMDDRRFARPYYRDPTLPPGPVPPGRIPEEDRRPGFFARLFGGDEDRAAPPERPPMVNGPRSEEPVRPPRVRRTPRVVEQAPDLIRPAPVESAPLAPPSAAPAMPKSVQRSPATPKPVEASLPAATAPAATPAPSAPIAPAPTSNRAISSDPLAIPGSREQDEKAVQANRGATSAVKPTSPARSEAQPKAAEPAKAAVPVAPLE